MMIRSRKLTDNLDPKRNGAVDDRSENHGRSKETTGLTF